MIIRPYQPEDCEALARLFYETVHTVNAKDYTEQQLNAWATGCLLYTSCSRNSRSFIIYSVLSVHIIESIIKPDPC